MPPTKMARHDRLQISHVASLPSVSARKVYDIPELRRLILRFLPMDGLAKFMRVERKVMPDAASFLYRWIHSDKLLKKMSKNAERQSLYTSSTSEVVFGDLYFHITAKMFRRLGFSDSRRQRIIVEKSEWCQQYQPVLFNFFVPPVIAKCSRVREIGFGEMRREAFGRDKWTVTLDRPGTPGGTIDLFQTRTFDLTRKPVARIEAPASPGSMYTIRYSFDLKLTVDGNGPLMLDEWIKAIREMDCLGDLDGAIDLGVLPVGLEDIANLYTKQVETGKDRRLQYVKAGHVLDYDIDALRFFCNTALLAGSPILHLNLASAYQDDNVKLTFADIPSIIAVVRKYLPNLMHLEIALRGVETAEDTCKHMLSADDLECGTIENLRIHTPKTPGNLFNVIRCLSRICTDSARIHIGLDNEIWNNHGMPDIDRKGRQSLFLQYLRMQCIERQRHLAVVDFAELDVATLEDDADLGYTEDHRPKRRGIAKAAQWAAQAVEAEKTSSVLLPLIQSGLTAFAEAGTALQRTSVSGSTTDILRNCQQLHRAMKEVGSLANELNRSLSWSMATEMKTYMASLERLERKAETVNGGIK